jgi:hypothetical protein
MAEQNLTETRVGLSNTCSKCGADPGPSWFAANDDAAQAGQGLCPSCAGQKQTLEERAQPNTEVDILAQNVAAVLRDAQGVNNERISRRQGAAPSAAEAEAKREEAPRVVQARSKG